MDEHSNIRFFNNKALFYLFLPLIIEQGLEYLVGLADSMMVAQVGEAAVSGVSLIDFIMMLIISVFAALATGGSVIASQYIGRKDTDNAKLAANQLVKGALIFSLVITAILYVIKPWILSTLFGSISPAVASAANTYFLVVALSIPFLALYNAGAAVFRTVGNAHLPMKIMLVMNIINVVGNAMLVLVFHMGVIGIAIPTLISRIGAAVTVLWFAHKESCELRLVKVFSTRIQRDMMMRILSIGAPFGFESGMFFLGRLIVLSVVALFGTASIAANSVAGSIIMFQVLPGMAINIGLSVIISRCVGAGDYEQANYYKRKIRLIIHTAFAVTSAVVIALMPLLMRIYNLSDEATTMTWTIVIMHGILMTLIWPSGYMLPVVFRGAGEAKFPMITSMLSMLIFRIALSYIFAVHLNMGMIGTWIAMFVDWTVKALLYEWYDRTGRWTNVEAI